MKKIYLLFSMFICLSSFAQQTFNGNGKTGYGGVIGTGSLTVNDDGTTISFKLTKGASDFNDAIVIFIDSKSGGFSTTSGFTDESDGLRKAISGLETPNRATLNFPSGFLPDYAIAVDKGFGGVWELMNGAMHLYLNSVNLMPTNNAMSPMYTFSVAKTDIGITSDIIFKFLVTYGSETGFRSNEFIGDAGPANNPDNNPYTATTFLNYVSALPLSLTRFEAQNANTSIRLNWALAQENDIDHFEIMRSPDGVNFQKIGTMASLGNTAIERQYSYTDNIPRQGNNFYRLAVVEKNGVVVYSKTITIKYGIAKVFKAYFNPDAREINVAITNTESNVFNVGIYNNEGQKIVVSRIDHSGADRTYTINPGIKLKQGIYTIVLAGGAARYSQQIFIR